MVQASLARNHEVMIPILEVILILAETLCACFICNPATCVDLTARYHNVVPFVLK